MSTDAARGPSLREQARTALERLLHDARQLDVGLRLAVGRDRRHRDALVLTTPDGYSIMFPDETLGQEHALARAVDAAHEWIVESLPGQGLPSNWPPCPRHPRNHPLVVPDEQDEVVWACPATGEVVARVGELLDVGGSGAPSSSRDR